MSNEKLGAEQGRETLQAIAQEIVANLGSCDASSDLGFKVIWATLDRHFGTGPKQAEQAYHARGAGQEALKSCPKCGGDITHEGGHGPWCRDERCKWGWEMEMEMDGSALREPGADTGTTVAEELSGMLAERMIKLAIKIQGPYATFGPPESLERRKKSHQERIEELTGMLTTEFAECLEAVPARGADTGTTPLATQPPQRWCPLDGRSCEEVMAICKPNSGYYLALVTPEMVQRAVGKFGADLPWCSSVARRINEALRRSDDSA